MPSLGRAFLRQILNPKLLKWIEIEKLTVETTKFCDDQFHETRPDMVYTVPIIGAEESIRFHVIFEHKSYNDHATIFQISKYVHQLYVQEVKTRLTDTKTKKHKKWPRDFQLSPIIPIILHHGSTRFTGEIELSKLFYPLPGAEEFLPHQKAVLVDLTKIEDDKLPRDENSPELHIVLLMMKVIFSKSPTAIRRKFSRILEELKPYSQNPMYRDLIYKLRHYVIWNAKKMDRTDYFEIKTEIDETIEERGDNMPTLAQIFIDEGRVEGRVEGESRAILRTLTRRFRRVPKQLEVRIRAVSDLARLEKLADFAFDCETLKEFTESLK